MKKLIVLCMLLLASCESGGTPRPEATPIGPPEIQGDAIESHSEQFTDLTNRAPGSQQEFAAATYITGHLQQAGYVIEFDAVPVANTVRSTNVVALPPGAEDPEYLVTVPYDNAGSPDSLGAFLEVARALRTAVPDHAVEFVALGAESTDALGTRRLIKMLQERELDPVVLTLDPSDEAPDLYEAAGFEHRPFQDPTSGFAFLLDNSE